MMTLHVLSWLLTAVSTKRKISEVDREIAEKRRSIEENEKGIAATQDIVEEAIRRTDDEFYRLRTRVGSAERRRSKAEDTVYGRFVRAARALNPTEPPNGDNMWRDLADGWNGGRDRE